MLFFLCYFFYYNTRILCNPLYCCSSGKVKRVLNGQSMWRKTKLFPPLTVGISIRVIFCRPKKVCNTFGNSLCIHGNRFIHSFCTLFIFFAFHRYEFDLGKKQTSFDPRNESCVFVLPWLLNYFLAALLTPCV